MFVPYSISSINDVQKYHRRVMFEPMFVKMTGRSTRK